MGETQEKKVSLVQTILFTICSVLVLDSLAGAPAFAGVRSITMWLIFAVIFFIPYGLLNAELGSTYPDASVWVIAAISLIMSWLIVWIGYRGVELSVTLTSIASICKMAILVIFGVLGAAYVIKNGPANAFTIDDFKITSMSDMSSGSVVCVTGSLHSHFQTVRYESEGICQSAFSIPAWPNDRNQISKGFRILIRSCLSEYNIF